MEIKLSIALLSLCICYAAMGSPLQTNDTNDDSIKKQMIKIKTDESYIAAEATDESQQEAYDMALSNVSFSINSQRSLKGLPPIALETIRPYAHSLTVNRGTKQRVLVYIVWEDIDNNGASGSIKVEINVEEDAHRTSIEEEDSTQLAEPPIIDVEPTSEAFEEVLTSLRITEMIVDAVQQLDAFKSEGKIAGYGRYDISQQLQGNTYLLLYDRTRAIRGRLEVRDDGILRDFKTYEIVSIQNYSDCKAYWFK